jgi:hypothetical protein
MRDYFELTDDHVRSQLWKRMDAVFGTFHFHVATKSGFEPVDPSLPGYSRQGYIGAGGGWREEPMQEHFRKLKRTAPVQSQGRKEFIRFLFCA